MTTTEIYYGKGIKKGKDEVVRSVGGVMDEMQLLLASYNPKKSRDWNKGFDDGIRTFYTALELTLRKEALEDA